MSLPSLLAQLSLEASSLNALDVLTIGTLTLLEGILSVDNALVLAILVRHLPPEQRRRGLTYGLVGAFVFRVLAIVFAASLIRFLAFKFIGGVYLLYLAMKNMFRVGLKAGREEHAAKRTGFLKTVAIVEMTDIVFSIDSITTAVAMSNKLLIVYIGGVLGIIFMRFLSGFFVTLLEKFPKLEDLAYQLVFFIGVRLTLESLHIEIDHTIFWTMMGVIAVIGSSLVYKDWMETKLAAVVHDDVIERLKRRELSLDALLQERKEISTATIRHLISQGYLRTTSRATIAEVETVH
jgi:YkoY family integral membrane protein